MAVNRSTEFVTLWAAPVMKYVFMEPLNRACARSAVLRFNELSLAGSSDPACSTYPRSPPHPAEEDDGLLAFHASGLIRKPVVDRPAFAIPAHVKANNGHGAVESDDPLIRLHARTLSDDLWSMNLSNGVGACEMARAMSALRDAARCCVLSIRRGLPASLTSAETAPLDQLHPVPERWRRWRGQGLAA